MSTIPQQINPSPVEKIKQESDSLRGTIAQGLKNDITGAISEDDQALVKFHGMYQQDDRDRREERAEKKLERLYSFMIRLRLPGGYLTHLQWVALHHIAGEYSTGVIKITTRQTVQLHGLIKSKIKPTIKAFSEAQLDSVATCGDVNRNVVCAAYPSQSPLHAVLHEYAKQISELLMPKSRAYYEIWLDEEMITNKAEEEDPLYQDRYLPRKFKIAIAIPPNNDIDVFANDIGLIAIIKDGELKGFNVAIGGGLSATHGNSSTYPRIASVIGFVEPGEKMLKVVYEIATIQRDYGNRSDRKLARLKYTVDRYGLDWFKAELEARAGFALQEAKSYHFTDRSDLYGWDQDPDGSWSYTPFIENGRILDTEKVSLKQAMLEIAETAKANFRFSGNQNIIITQVQSANKNDIDFILTKHNVISHTLAASAIRKNSMACVALPTCPLALAEGQRYLPVFLDKFEPLLAQHGLLDEQIVIRMTGCPNGCARPYLAEIGLVGTNPGTYNLHVGGDREGTRLNRVYRQSLSEHELLNELDSLLIEFTKGRNDKESFGDFTFRYCF